MSEDTNTQPTQEMPEATPAKAETKAKKPATTWLDRLKTEAKELEERHKLLDVFLASPQYTELEKKSQVLLKSQHTYQTLLLDVLKQRIELASEA